MLGLLVDELGQVHLVGEAPFGGHRGDERLQVLGHRLLSGEELGGQPGGVSPLDVGHRREVEGVLGEIDVRGVPVLGDALGEQAHRKRFLAETAGAERGVAVRDRRVGWCAS